MGSGPILRCHLASLLLRFLSFWCDEARKAFFDFCRRERECETEWDWVRLSETVWVWDIWISMKSLPLVAVLLPLSAQCVPFLRAVSKAREGNRFFGTWSRSFLFFSTLPFLSLQRKVVRRDRAPACPKMECECVVVAKICAWWCRRRSWGRWSRWWFGVVVMVHEDDVWGFGGAVVVVGVVSSRIMKEMIERGVWGGGGGAEGGDVRQKPRLRGMSRHTDVRKMKMKWYENEMSRRENSNGFGFFFRIHACHMMNNSNFLITSVQAHSFWRKNQKCLHYHFFFRIFTGAAYSSVQYSFDT